MIFAPESVSRAMIDNQEKRKIDEGEGGVTKVACPLFLSSRNLFILG